MPTDIDDARSAFEDGIDRESAQKWQDRATDSSDEYEDEFADILKDQNECAEETEGLSGYERMMEYADCVGGKANGGGA